MLKVLWMPLYYHSPVLASSLPLLRRLYDLVDIWRLVFFPNPDVTVDKKPPSPRPGVHSSRAQKGLNSVVRSFSSSQQFVTSIIALMPSFVPLCNMNLDKNRIWKKLWEKFCLTLGLVGNSEARGVHKHQQHKVISTWLFFLIRRTYSTHRCRLRDSRNSFSKRNKLLLNNFITTVCAHLTFFVLFSLFFLLISKPSDFVFCYL